MDHLCPRECLAGAVCLVCFSRPDTELDTYVRPRTVGTSEKRSATLSPRSSRSTLSPLFINDGHHARPRTAGPNLTSTASSSSRQPSPLPSPSPCPSRMAIRESTRSSRSLFQRLVSKVGPHIKKARSSPPTCRLPKTPSTLSLSSLASSLRPNDSAVDLSQLRLRPSKSSLRQDARISVERLR